MKRFILLLFGFLFVHAQELDSLTTGLDALEIAVALPFTSSELKKSDISERNLGQDIPILLKNTASIVSTSDAGAGIGYTGLRIRGSDASRINVTLDGVPVNDSESHGVFWVNMPDLASSTNSIEVQRGLGTSVNGSGAFGATVNINTDSPSEESFLKSRNSIGSFGTRMHNLQIGTGDLGNGFNVSGRVSQIVSDGYIDRASSDLFAYNAQIQYKKGDRKIRFKAFGGQEVTYQSWFGIDEQTLVNDRRFNPAGAILNNLTGEIEGFYDNQVDDYKQNHYHLHYWDKLWGGKFKATAHLTTGKGFFEEYRNSANLGDYNLEIGVSDLVRRQWLDNDFYGLMLNWQKKIGDTNFIFGAAANRYDGDHFGRVIFAADISNFTPDHEYYRNNGRKDEFNVFAKAVHKINNIELFGDLQFRSINYLTSQQMPSVLEDFRQLDESFNFINPKAGVTYNTNLGAIYLSYALGHREPNRADFLDNETLPQSEQLQDFELGFRKKNTTPFALNANLYYMRYNNQLVPTGALNDVGAPLRENAGKSYRLGLELESEYKLNTWFTFLGNVSISSNRNLDWTEDINGTKENFGNTTTAFSPSVIANVGMRITPMDNLIFNLTGKHVGEQYMSNANFAQSKLDAYTFVDANVSYKLLKVNPFKYVSFNLLVNNIFNSKFENNGYYFNFFDGNSNDNRGLNHNPFFYPQAGTNFIIGVEIGL